MVRGHIHHAAVTRVKLGVTVLLAVSMFHPAIALVASICWLWIEED